MDEVLPAEFAGMAAPDGGVLDVGGVTLSLPVRWSRVPVYARRSTEDLAISEVAIALDDSLAQEELDAESAEADGIRSEQRSTGARRWSERTGTAPTSTR